MVSLKPEGNPTGEKASVRRRELSASKGQATKGQLRRWRKAFKLAAGLL